MGKFYFAFAWDIIVNLHVCICKNKICIGSDIGVNLSICTLNILRCVFAFACAICLPRVIFAHRSIFTRVYFWRMRIGLFTSFYKIKHDYIPKYDWLQIANIIFIIITIILI